MSALHTEEFPPSWIVTLLRTAFPTLTAEVPPAVLDLATQRTAKEGEIVCTPDRPLDALTIVITGGLRLDKDGHTIRDFGPGDYFGEGGLVRDASPAVTITAIETTDLLEFRRDALHIIIATEPAFGLSFLQALLAETMGRLQATNQLFADNRSLARQLAQTVQRLEGALSQVQISEERMRFLASHDPLTRLGNRALLQDQLEAAIRQSGRPRERFALHMIALDNFKAISDFHGHGVGDKVLATVAERIGEISRTADTIARLGDDKFAVRQELREGDESGNVRALAARLIEDLSAPMAIAGHELLVGASVGVALYPDDGASADDLMRHADVALHRAVVEGSGRYVCFTPALGEQALRLAAIKASLRNAATLEPGAAVPREPGTAAARRRRRQCTTVTVKLSAAGLRRQDIAALIEDALTAAGLPSEALEIEVADSPLQSAEDR
jgi:diguanylate cyclase (GGDEF)-like protein